MLFEALILVSKDFVYQKKCESNNTDERSYFSIPLELNKCCLFHKRRFFSTTCSHSMISKVSFTLCVSSQFHFRSRLFSFFKSFCSFWFETTLNAIMLSILFKDLINWITSMLNSHKTPKPKNIEL